MNDRRRSRHFFVRRHKGWSDVGDAAFSLHEKLVVSVSRQKKVVLTYVFFAATVYIESRKDSARERYFLARCHALATVRSKCVATRKQARNQRLLHDRRSPTDVNATGAAGQVCGPGLAHVTGMRVTGVSLRRMALAGLLDG
ncbi:hypothetical protein PQR02_36445 [Paraburkholderia sediminicola]|uniref:Uncharacterized protein n=1 Tax=Paraburkholderia rhynchosiae TaxID=487049 RepID=A0ACC7NTH2_9BURK